MLRFASLIVGTGLFCFFSVGQVASQEPASADVQELRKSAEQAMRRAAEFFRREVATEGGYLWRYSADLQTREGEGRASETTIWVQTPGTPAVGQAFLSAYEATGEEFYLEGARAAGEALLRGQLRSGGWDYRIEFDPKLRKKYAYRVDDRTGQPMDVTTYDDDVTQGALRFLIELDRVTKFKDHPLREAIDTALDAVLRSQYANGAWPQRFHEFADRDESAPLQANYPEDWPRVYPGADYRAHYTFNDNLIRDMVDTLLLAWRVYDRADCREAVLRAGDFILLAQMPEPQPAWAQQYNEQMQPAWARKFEPPAITGGESQGVRRTLLVIYDATGESRFLEPLPRAIEYFRASQLPDGRLARFYELQTNHPLYFTTDYQLTYEDDDLPTHYSFKSASSMDQIEALYQRCLERPAGTIRPVKRSKPRLSSDLAERVGEVIARLDAEGRWIESGRLRYHGEDDPTRQVIDCRTFNRNMQNLAEFLLATQN